MSQTPSDAGKPEEDVKQGTVLPPELEGIKTQEELLALINQQKLDTARIEAAIKMYPDLVKGVVAATESLTQTANQAGKSQGSSLDAINQVVKANLEAYKELAARSQSDELLARAFERLCQSNDELTRRIEKMNDSNNSFFSKHGGKVAATAGLLVGGGILALLKGRK